jgi:hypothetical protein
MTHDIKKRLRYKNRIQIEISINDPFLRFWNLFGNLTAVRTVDRRTPDAVSVRCWPLVSVHELDAFLRYTDVMCRTKDWDSMARAGERLRQPVSSGSSATSLVLFTLHYTT